MRKKVLYILREKVFLSVAHHRLSYEYSKCLGERILKGQRELGEEDFLAAKHPDYLMFIVK